MWSDVNGPYFKFQPSLNLFTHILEDWCTFDQFGGMNANMTQGDTEHTSMNTHTHTPLQPVKIF